MAIFSSHTSLSSKISPTESPGASTKGSLTGEVALISGGAHGIGKAVAMKLATLGCKVVIADLPAENAPDVVKEINQLGGEADYYVGDVSVETQSEVCVADTIERFGRLDILVNLWGTPLEEIPTDHLRTSDFDHVIFSNVRSVFLMTKFALPYLRETRGVVLSAGSDQGIMGLSLNPAHGASLAWVHAFMKGVAQENARYGVRANSVRSGPVDTVYSHALMELDPDVEKRLVEQTPLGRRGTTNEVASVYAFLASDEASFVTGALYTVDGGLSSGTTIPSQRTTSEVGARADGREEAISDGRSATRSEANA